MFYSKALTYANQMPLRCHSSVSVHQVLLVFNGAGDFNQCPS